MRFDEEIHSGFRTCRRGIWAVGLFSLVLNLLMLTQPLYMTQVYDRVLSSRSEETLLMLSIVALGALAVIGILEIVRQIVRSSDLGVAALSSRSATLVKGDEKSLRA